MIARLIIYSIIDCVAAITALTVIYIIAKEYLK